MERSNLIWFEQQSLNQNLGYQEVTYEQGCVSIIWNSPSLLIKLDHLTFERQQKIEWNRLLCVTEITDELTHGLILYREVR